MLLYPTSHVATMGACMCAVVVEAEASRNAKPSCGSDLVTEYADVFKPPGMPVEHEINH